MPQGLELFGEHDEDIHLLQRARNPYSIKKLVYEKQYEFGIMTKIRPIMTLPLESMESNHIISFF